MKTFKGQVLYADGTPIAGVTVRIYDRDAGKNDDDDLTELAGHSDSEGFFEVVYEPSRYLDYTRPGLTATGEELPFDWTHDIFARKLSDLADVYLPYLRFTYQRYGEERTHEAYLTLFKRTFRLPDLPPRVFKPSVHGFRFPNRFQGYFIPFSVPALPDIPSPNNIYGMCGGMVAAALDLMYAGVPRPESTQIPIRRTPLHGYIYQRQNDSLGAFGNQVVKFAHYMALPDDGPYGTMRRTLSNFISIRGRLDDHNPVPIGLVYVSARDTLRIWENHQVLATHYELTAEDRFRLYLYDPNHPLDDLNYLECERVTIAGNLADNKPLYGLKCAQFARGKYKKRVRAFFAMPYVPVRPSGGFEDQN